MSSLQIPRQLVRAALIHQTPAKLISPSIATTTRTFTTSSPLLTKTIRLTRIPKDLVPPYPYGPRHHFKQSNTGLYGTAKIRFGNNVSEKYNVKSPRFWRVNTHRKRIFSEALGAYVRTRLSTRVFRCIIREGGLDNYVLKSKPARIKELGPGGWRLRWLIMQTPAVRERMGAEWKALGIEGEMASPPEGIVQVAMDFATPGPLSASTREILATRAREFAEMEEFVFGEEGDAAAFDALEDGELEGGDFLNDPATEASLARARAESIQVGEQLESQPREK